MIDGDRAAAEVDLLPTQGVHLAGTRPGAQRSDEVGDRCSRLARVVARGGQHGHQGGVLLPVERLLRLRFLVDSWRVGARDRAILGQLGDPRRVPDDVTAADCLLQHLAQHLLVVPAGRTRLRLDALPPCPGDPLRGRRVDLGLTQAELAELSGISQGDISKIENSHLDARWSTIKRLSDALASVKEPKASLANGGHRRPKPDVSDIEPWKPEGKTKRSITVVK
ncbi:MAG: helix-turn-helix domain-containing protein [Rhodococcus sp. (in: high G+C Gram-positive bacteria)]